MLLSKKMLRSFAFFFKLLFRKKEYDVIFVNSVVFNRNDNGGNSLFQPFFEVCERLKLNYIIIEDADLKGEYKQFERNRDAIPFDFISLISIILRKLFNKKISKLNSLEKDIFISKILKRYFLYNLDSKIYITLIWNKVTLWRLLSPEATVVDYQHGITMNGHKGYLLDGRPPAIKTFNNITTLVFSNKIKKILINNDKTNFYNNENVITVGVNNELMNLSNIDKKIILFTLQLTPDFSKKINTNYIKTLREIVNSILKHLEKNDYKIVLKHHPRYSDNFDLTFNHDFITISDDNLEELLKKAKLHITFNSTSAIDAALLGIPSIFIDLQKEFSPKDIFFDQFHYPFDNLLIHSKDELAEAIGFIEYDYKYISNKVYQWANNLNNDFDKEKLKGFLMKKLNKNE